MKKKIFCDKPLLRMSAARSGCDLDGAGKSMLNSWVDPSMAKEEGSANSR